MDPQGPSGRCRSGHCYHTCFYIFTVDVVKKEKKLVSYFRVKVTGQTVKTENILLLSVLF